ncbi:hypothetical protein ACH4UT_34235 [Streptomyces sp. NPDC020799]|uniref:hypothetical protein n=1 Tax=Streptomyces sp. NPDC020799 TaxID=3365091 RepID=UPI00378DCCC6
MPGSFSDEPGRELFSVSTELSQLAGWTAFDVGQHEVAQRHFIQALRLVRAGGDVQLGCYVLTTMAMQALTRVRRGSHRHGPGRLRTRQA